MVWIGTWRRAVRFAVVAAALATAWPGALGAQGSKASEPAAYSEGMELLSAGDTLAAIDRFREATRVSPDFGPAYLRLGALLSARAGEREREFQERQEAERALRQALRLMGDHPEVLLEYGLLLRKQQIHTDAKRVLDRAWQAAERRGKELTPDERARMHFALGKVYETWWNDWQNLVMIPPAQADALHCGAMDGPQPHHVASVLCPRAWADQAEHVVPLADLKSEERERMMNHFRLALEADPGHVDAAVHLLGHLADAGAWEEYERVARRLVLAAPDDPRSHLFLGLGLHETGRGAGADSAFQRALALLPAEERRVFEDVTPLLPRRVQERVAALDSAARAEAANIFFASADPLYLTPYEERRLEHYSRLAWAELKFSEPASGNRGWESERGRIWVRYGAPWKWYQCCYGAAYLQESAFGQVPVRYVYWSYGPYGPVFVFSRLLTHRRAQLVVAAKYAADQLEDAAPQMYRPRTITSVHEIPHQVARFRGREPNLTKVEFYAAPPLDSLAARPGMRLSAGIFLFDMAYRELWSQRHEVNVGDRPLALTYRVELPAGAYRYGREARTSGPDSVARPAARSRAELTVEAFPEDRLASSDLLLADGLGTRGVEPKTRDDLFLVASRTLRFEQGAPIHLYFEVYGLTVDADSMGAYRAELAVEDSTRRNVVERLARGATELFRRRGGDARVTWDRVVPVRDGRAMDYLTIELPSLEPGEYVVRVRVTEPATGQGVEARRAFTVTAVGPPEERRP